MVPSNCSHTLAVFVRFALSTHILSTARGHAVHFSPPEGSEADLHLFKGNKQTSLGPFITYQCELSFKLIFMLYLICHLTYTIFFPHYTFVSILR